MRTHPRQTSGSNAVATLKQRFPSRTSAAVAGSKAATGQLISIIIMIGACRFPRPEQMRPTVPVQRHSNVTARRHPRQTSGSNAVAMLKQRFPSRRKTSVAVAGSKAATGQLISIIIMIGACRFPRPEQMRPTVPVQRHSNVTARRHPRQTSGSNAVAMLKQRFPSRRRTSVAVAGSKAATGQLISIIIMIGACRFPRPGQMRPTGNVIKV